MSPRSASPNCTFRPHPLVRGGHLQTLATLFFNSPALPGSTATHPVAVSGGDTIVLHDDCPEGWNPSAPRLLLVHGMCGDHRTSYMTRLAIRFTRLGVRVFRLDMRCAGASFQESAHLNHAGRSDDIAQAALEVLRVSGEGPLWLAGVSLGGSQMLKMLGELHRNTSHRDGNARLVNAIERAAVVAPPVHLQGCADKMDRLHMRPYNRYFIKNLLGEIPPRVRANPLFPNLEKTKVPRTMRQLDHRITAPLSGYESADDYYRRNSPEQFAIDNQTPTLVLAARSDPIVPVQGFLSVQWPQSTELEIAACGGHVAFLGRGREKLWLDQRLEDWFCQKKS